MHIDNVIFLILSKIAYTKFSDGPKGGTQMKMILRIITACSYHVVSRSSYLDIFRAYLLLLALVSAGKWNYLCASCGCTYHILCKKRSDSSVHCLLGQPNRTSNDFHMVFRKGSRHFTLS